MPSSYGERKEDTLLLSWNSITPHSVVESDLLVVSDGSPPSDEAGKILDIGGGQKLLADKN